MKIDITIEPEVLAKIKNAPGLYELCGMPDAGVTFSAVEVIDSVIAGDETGLFVGNVNNVPELNSLRKIARRNATNIIIAAVDYSSLDVVSFVAGYSELARYIVIDDFALIVLNRHRAAITYIVNGLRKIAKENNLIIIIANQLRYQVQNGTGEELKPLYWDYTQNDIDERFMAVKTKTSITVKEYQLGCSTGSPFDSFMDFLNSIEE